MSLTEKRARMIGSRLASLIAELGRPAFAGRKDRSRGVENQALRRAGQANGQDGTPPSSNQEQAALERLVLEGEITQLEADAYMAARHPGERYAGGWYGDQGQAALDAEVLDSAARRRGGRRTRATPGPEQEAPATERQFPTLRLPATYDAAAVQRAIDAAAEEAAIGLASLRARPPAPETGTIPGDALTPGSVPLEALDLRELGRRLLALPEESEAIGVQLKHSATMDRYVRRASTGDVGPGRIWECGEIKATERSRIGAGPARYRIIKGGQKFGVMSVRLPTDADLSANSTPGLLIQYGIVLARIPHFLGRPPSRLLAFESVGDSPVAFRVLFSTGGNGNVWTSGGTSRDFYWKRTQAEHLGLGSFPFATAFGSDTALIPSGASLRDALGFQVQLITGRDGGQVWRQLCTRFTLGRELLKDGHGPALTLPSGLPIEAPAPSVCIDWQNPTAYTHRIETYDLSTAGTRVVMGMPFSYNDCAALAPSDTHFSVVVMPLGEKLVSQTVPPLTSFGQPDVWHKNGLQLTDAAAGRLRSWGLDIILD